MNERIRELLKQSNYDARYCSEYFDPAKFAELIVRECASQVRFTDLLKCNDDSDGEILLQASVQLKQHFGVEE
jgi:hypothetical protein